VRPHRSARAYGEGPAGKERLGEDGDQKRMLARREGSSRAPTARMDPCRRAGVLGLEAFSLVGTVAERLVRRVSAAAEEPVSALAGDHVTLRIQHLDLALHLKRTVRYRSHGHRHRLSS